MPERFRVVCTMQGAIQVFLFTFNLNQWQCLIWPDCATACTLNEGALCSSLYFPEVCIVRGQSSAPSG